MARSVSASKLDEFLSSSSTPAAPVSEDPTRAFDQIRSGLENGTSGISQFTELLNAATRFIEQGQGLIDRVVEKNAQRASDELSGGRYDDIAPRAPPPPQPPPPQIPAPAAPAPAPVQLDPDRAAAAVSQHFVLMLDNVAAQHGDPKASQICADWKRNEQAMKSVLVEVIKNGTNDSVPALSGENQQAGSPRTGGSDESVQREQRSGVPESEPAGSRESEDRRAEARVREDSVGGEDDGSEKAKDSDE